MEIRKREFLARDGGGGRFTCSKGGVVLHPSPPRLPSSLLFPLSSPLSVHHPHFSGIIIKKVFLTYLPKSDFGLSLITRLSRRNEGLVSSDTLSAHLTVKHSDLGRSRQIFSGEFCGDRRRTTGAISSGDV